MLCRYYYYYYYYYYYVYYYYYYYFDCFHFPKDSPQDVIRFKLSRYALMQDSPDLNYLIGALMSSRGFDDVHRLCPFLSSQDFDVIIKSVASYMLYVCRQAHIRRCLRLLKQLQSSLTLIGSATPPEPDQIQLETAALVSALQVSNHYMQPLNNQTDQLSVPAQTNFDPRYLTFEFLHLILLRKMQVTLIEQFRTAAAAQTSAVHQMIMGAGKTTVIGPLLVLLLADGKSLVTQVVPSSLVSMTRSILRSRFCSVISKRVHSLEFDRSLPDNPAIAFRLVAKLLDLRQSRGVLVCADTAVKALHLKFVELLESLERHGKAHAEPRATPVTEDQLYTYSNKYGMAEGLANVINVWRSGTLLMDEVDLLLHPLRSELNFPIGSKIALKPSPERWELPLHLLDAVFFSESKFLSQPAMRDNAEAASVLKSIEDAIQLGYREKALQRSPHLVLLSERFYKAHLLLPLAHWTLLYLRTKGLSSQNGAHLHKQSVSPSSSALATVHGDSDVLNLLVFGWQKRVPEHAFLYYSESTRQLIHLAHNWLHCLAPHCLAKINRVSFGMLDSDYIGKHTPMSRRITAVPFVGKDVPSRASEFAHPDVLIGLTALSFRSEGLRFDDVSRLVAQLKQNLSDESGPLHSRPSALKFASWIADWDQCQAKFCSAPIKLVSLPFLHLSDRQSMNNIYAAFRKLPSVILHFLLEHVYPAAMFTHSYNLSASGQELGSSALFGLRLGFSGTPSDLLPVELGSCQYEKGSDGKMLSVLTDRANVGMSLCSSDWSVRQVMIYSHLYNH